MTLPDEKALRALADRLARYRTPSAEAVAAAVAALNALADRASAVAGEERERVADVLLEIIAEHRRSAVYDHDDFLSWADRILAVLDREAAISRAREETIEVAARVAEGKGHTGLYAAARREAAAELRALSSLPAARTSYEHQRRVAEWQSARLEKAERFAPTPSDVDAALAGERIPGLPTDPTVTAIGYSADGLPHILRWIPSRIDGPDAWGGVGFEADVSTSAPIRVVHLLNDMADFIVEHEIVRSRATKSED